MYYNIRLTTGLFQTFVLRNYLQWPYTSFKEKLFILQILGVYPSHREPDKTHTEATVCMHITQLASRAFERAVISSRP